MSSRKLGTKNPNAKITLEWGVEVGDRVIVFNPINKKRGSVIRPTQALITEDCIVIPEVYNKLKCGVNDIEINQVTTHGQAKWPALKFTRQSDGTLWCAYTRAYDYNYGIAVSKSTDNGKTWSEETITEYGEDCTIAVDSQDRLHLIYPATDSDWELYYRVYENGEWSEGEFITSASDPGYTRPQYYPNLVIDNNDTLHLLWTGYAEGYTYDVLWYMNKTESGWSTKECLSGNVNVGGYPDILVVGTTVYTIWLEGTGEFAKICQSYNSGTGWSAKSCYTGETYMGQARLHYQDGYKDYAFRYKDDYWNPYDTYVISFGSEHSAYYKTTSRPTPCMTKSQIEMTAFWLLEDTLRYATTYYGPDMGIDFNYRLDTGVTDWPMSVMCATSPNWVSPTAGGAIIYRKTADSNLYYTRTPNYRP